MTGHGPGVGVMVGPTQRFKVLGAAGLGEKVMLSYTVVAGSTQNDSITDLGVATGTPSVSRRLRRSVLDSLRGKMTNRGASLSLAVGCKDYRSITPNAPLPQ